MALSVAATCSRQSRALLAKSRVSCAVPRAAGGDVRSLPPRASSLTRTRLAETRTVATQTNKIIFSSSNTLLQSSVTRARQPIQPTTRPVAYIQMSTMSTDTGVPEPQKFMRTSGATDSVWVHKMPYEKLPKFSPLDHDIETEICILGAGISGITTAFELVKRGKQVVMIEARDVLSGESGRTSGHLNNDLDDGYEEIVKKHGEKGGKLAAASHAWARDRIGEISKELGIECEYRKLPSYNISQYTVGTKEHDDEVKELKAEVEAQKRVGIESYWKDDLKVRGWDGKPDQRGGQVAENQATFHPTRYLAGVLEWLKKQPNFQCYIRTRAMAISEKGMELLGMGHKSVQVETEAGNTIRAEYAVEATCVPLQKLSVIAQMEFYRTYCIAIRVPKGSVEDCLLYDNAEEYKYVRLTECDEKDDYMVVGGCDHKVGQEETTSRFEELEQWARERFTQAGTVDYKWSGQIFEPVDYMAYIGKNQGQDKIFIVTGDSGDGLTHGTMAGRLIADEVDGVQNEWAELYSPKRLGSLMQTLPAMISHDVQINAQYKRFLQSDITDIEDLVPGSGGVLNPKTSKPVAVYKDENGKVHTFSALCPHMKGVICWNATEKSWDCPVHGSRFSKDGICIIGPAKGSLQPEDDAGKAAASKAVNA